MGESGNEHQVLSKVPSFLELRPSKGGLALGIGLMGLCLHGPHLQFLSDR